MKIKAARTGAGLDGRGLFVVHMEWTANGVTQHAVAHLTKDQFDEFVRDCIRATDLEGIDQ